MEKCKKIEPADRFQMYMWTTMAVVFIVLTVWDLINGGGRSFATGGISMFFCVTNLNIVLNRITFRNAMRKKDADT